MHGAQRVDQRRNVEDVAQALAIRLEHDGKRAVPGGHTQEILRALALLPQRRAAPRTSTGQQQRATGALAESGGEERGRAELPDDQRLDLIGVGYQPLRVGWLVGLRESHDEAVIGPHGLDVEAHLLAQPRRHGHRPRGEHLGAEWREQTQPPVAEFVLHALDDDGAVVGDGAGCFLLLGEVLHEVDGGECVEIVMRLESLAGLVGRLAPQLTHEGADLAAELQRTPGAVALPEGHLAGLSRCGRHRDAVVGDVLDAPRRGAEQEGLADPALEDHLLVELTDAGRTDGRAGEEDAVEPAVGDGAGVGHGHPLGALARRHAVRDAIPGDARPQLGEFVRRVAARQHVEHAVEDGAGEGGKRRGLADAGEQVVDVPVVHGDHGDDLLREHVERIARHVRRLDPTVAHRPDGGGTGQQVAAVLREDQAGAGGVDAMAGPADSLQATGHRWRCLDLDHEVHGAHVDAELERGGAGQPTEASGLEGVLDLDALFAGQRSMVRPHQGLAGQFVDGGGEPFGETPAVDEEQRRRVREDHFEQPGMDRGPDRRRLRSGGGRPAGDRLDLRQPRHVLDRHFDAQ